MRDHAQTNASPLKEELLYSFLYRGARHGLNMSGKLARLQQQEAAFIKQKGFTDAPLVERPLSPLQPNGTKQNNKRKKLSNKFGSLYSLDREKFATNNEKLGYKTKKIKTIQ